MPDGNFHKKLYDELIRLNPNLKYDFKIFSKAIDLYDITQKKTTHRNFFKFKLTYHLIEKRSGRFGTSTDESLRYLWVNHLVTDFVFNERLSVFKDEKSARFPLWKVIAQLGLPYLRYGMRLAKRLGMRKEDLRILRKELEKPNFFHTREGLRRWQLTKPHFEHRLIGNPENRVVEDG